ASAASWAVESSRSADEAECTRDPTGSETLGGSTIRGGHMRVLITGMGGELGTRIANLLEADPRIEALRGLDSYPPRRRITRVDFHRIEPDDRRRIHRLVVDFDPEVIMHFGVYEPHAHFGDPAARRGTFA